MQNADIARILSQVAEMLEVQGENFFRVRAYRNAARAILDYPAPLVELDLKTIHAIPGVGADLAGKIISLIATGDFPLYRELLQQVPSGLLELLTLPGCGPKRVKLLADRLGVRDRASLRRAIEAGQLRRVRGFGIKIEQQILQALSRQNGEGPKRMLFRDATVIAEALLAHLRNSDAVIEVEIAGSFRRRRETIGDLDVLVASTAPERVAKHLLAFREIGRTVGSGETKTSVVLANGLQVDVRVVPPQSWGAALVYFTGSQAHCIHLRRIAQAKGLLLNEYGLFREGNAIAGADEDGIYRALGLPFIPPELREERGEIKAAAEGHLPKLITRADLRGDLHSHSTWTDGRCSIKEMALAARQNGLEYFALTDHSRRLAMVNGLDPERVRQQRREVEEVRATVKGITILHGIEVDILDDGSLDLPDETLAELDWVVASVHSKLNEPAAEMTRRIVGAMRNPHVDVIGHPCGRLINQREASKFDFGEVLRVAREVGCALEVNSQPDRLDLSDTACLAARQAGVKLVISSDSHHLSGFGLLDFGVSQARRGWVEAGDVLNTRPLANLRPHHGRKSDTHPADIRHQSRSGTP
jgi:DNA polymerase (family X)